ncbi:MAG: DUF2254 domain-containing protein [Methanococcoides sp.]|nr:DUF2254 domain-containing protein [Methanococcoides sp.]
MATLSFFKENFNTFITVKTVFEIMHKQWQDILKFLNEPKWPNRVSFYILFFACVSLAFILSIMLLSAFFPKYNFLHTGINPDNARYMLSALIQSLAAVVAIVITLSLVAIQLSAQSYSSRVIDVYRKTPDIWILISIYTTTIFLGLATIKIIGTNALPTNGLVSLEFSIFATYFLGFFCFICLIPYIWNTLALLNPSTVVQLLAEDITEDKIPKTEDEKRTTLDENNPLLPIIDIINGSMMKYDYATVRTGVNAIIIQTGEILNNENEKKISRHVCKHLEKVSILALKREDEESSSILLIGLTEIGISAADNELKGATSSVINSLSIIGEYAAKKNLKWTTHYTLEYIYLIIMKSIQNEWDWETSASLIYFNIIVEKVIENKWEGTTKFTINIFKIITEEATKNNLDFSLVTTTDILYQIQNKAKQNEWNSIAKETNREIEKLKRKQRIKSKKST